MAALRDQIKAILDFRTPNPSSDFFALIDPNVFSSQEIAANVLPLNFSYIPGHSFRYMTPAQITDVVSGSLTLDVSASINAAIRTGHAVTLGEGYHGVTSSVSTQNLKSVVIRGTSYKSQIVNIAGGTANTTPTLLVVGSIYFEFSGFVVGGRAGFPNHGVIIAQSATFTGAVTANVLTVTALTGTLHPGDLVNGAGVVNVTLGSQLTGTIGGTGTYNFIHANVAAEPMTTNSQVAFGVLNDIILQPNGNGIEFQQCNTIQLNRVHYWPSNGIGGILNTVDVGTRKYGAFANNTAGNFSNEITLNACNMTGVDNTIAGYASIDIRAPGIGGTQVVRLIDCEVENTPINLFNIYNPQIDGCYVDRCVITFNNCRYGNMNNSYNAKTIAMVSCVNVIASNLAQGVAGDTLTIDAGCINCGVINYSGVAVTDAGTNSTLLNWNLAGVVQPDKLNIGKYVVPAYAAGNFTANGAMTWTVTNPQAVNYRYTLDGKRMTVAWFITGSTVGGTLNSALQIAIPAGLLANSRTVTPCFVLNNAIFTTGRAEVNLGLGNIFIFINNAGPNYIAGVTDTYGEIVFDVQ